MFGVRPGWTTWSPRLMCGVLNPCMIADTGHPARDLPAETATRSTIIQIYEGTNQIQRMVMARQLLKG
jgi:alkylation response protein AidB-like acyl-CoA dehydrogenase